MNSAIILVDVQNDFLPGGALAVPDGDAVVHVANRLIDAGRAVVVATQDWHPRDHGSFAANHPGTAIGDVIDLDGLDQILWPVHCVQETDGARFAPGLHTARIDRVFPKGTRREVDSYSGFYDNGHRHDTGLTTWLRERGVESVCVMGLATDYCVKWTALDAVRDGFRTTLVTDGCRGVELTTGDVERALSEMQAAGIRMTTSDEVLEERRAAI